MKHDLRFFSLDLSDLYVNPAWLDKMPNLLGRAGRAWKHRIAQGDVGFFSWPSDLSTTDLDAMTSLASELRESFSGALLFGIGGSFLGAEAFLEALRSPEDLERFPLHWVSNIDPVSIERATRFAKRGKIAHIVISKSGNTAETMAAFFHFFPDADKKGIVAITDPEKGELRRMATENGWRTLPVPPTVGGRFSVLTAVGLFPCALGAIAPAAILEGAKAMQHELLQKADDANPAHQMALAKFLWDVEAKRPIQFLMPYAACLYRFAQWYVQLWAESLGKKTRESKRSVGPTPVPALGTSDQHSLLQLFKEGPGDKLIGFLNVDWPATTAVVGKPALGTGNLAFLTRHTFADLSDAAARATRQSLRNAGCPTYEIRLREMTAQALGALTYFFEVGCALAGELYDVEAFDQPGVEETKRLMREFLT